MNKHKIKFQFQFSLEQTEGIADMEVLSGSPNIVEFSFVGCRDSSTNIAPNWEFGSADDFRDLGLDCEEADQKMVVLPPFILVILKSNPPFISITIILES